MEKTSTISDFFEKDHNRLDNLFKQFQASKSNDFALAKSCFKEFMFGLKRHIVWEEEILFPIFEQKTGMRDSGPTAVMRFEHELINKALDGIHKKIKEGRIDTELEESSLMEVLVEHNSKEEGILYPAMDQLLTPPEVNMVFEKIKKSLAEQQPTCCDLH